MSEGIHPQPCLHTSLLPPSCACTHPLMPTPLLMPTFPVPQRLLGQQETHMAGVASSGALIRVPSFSRWQNSSLICTPGYGEAPDGRNGWWVRGAAT